MKTIRSARYFLAVIALLTTMSVANVCIAEDQASNDPAQDPIYIKLKAKDVNDMTPREYEIFKQKEAAVTQYRMSAKSREASDAMTRTMNTSSTMTYVWIGISVLSLLLIVH